MSEYFQNWKTDQRSIGLIVFAVLLLLGTIVMIKRDAVLTGIAEFLITQDSLDPAYPICILGGNSHERGHGAALLYPSLSSPLFICTGGNVPQALIAVNQPICEAQLSKLVLLEEDVPEACIRSLDIGTSTEEEARIMLDYCRREGLRQLAVLSSNFHLRRVKYTFEKAFKNSGISLKYYGVHSTDYSAENWWKTEEGLIMLNNEYMKLLYYYSKY